MEANKARLAQSIHQTHALETLGIPLTTDEDDDKDEIIPEDNEAENGKDPKLQEWKMPKLQERITWSP